MQPLHDQLLFSADIIYNAANLNNYYAMGGEQNIYTIHSGSGIYSKVIVVMHHTACLCPQAVEMQGDEKCWIHYPHIRGVHSL